MLDENVVRGAGEALASRWTKIAGRLARMLGEAGDAAGRPPPGASHAVCEELIRRFSRQNALIGVVVFLPGADLPVLTLNQVRLVLRIADAHGLDGRP